MAKDEYVPFTGKLDAAPQFEPFDGTLDGEKPKDPGILRKAGDLGLSVAKGIVAVPEAAVGLADIPTGGRVGKFLENEGGAFGFRPKQAKEYLGSLQSDDLRDKQQQFQKADGIIDKAGVALSNPSLITNAVAESVPLMGAGAVPARALLAAAPRVGAAAAGAIGEGVVGAGSAAEQIRQETPDALLTPTQSGLAAATGAAASLFGFAVGKVAQRLGIGDVDTMFAQGAARAAGAPSAKSIPRQVVEGAIAEGWLEELPQSVSEQVLQNLALNKPWHEGVDDAAVMGTLSGMAMGSAAAGASGFSARGPQPADQQPPTQPPAPAPDAGPTLALPAPDRGVIQVGPDGTARTPAYQAPGYVGDVTDVEPRPIDPVREQVAAAAEQGGALSSAALTAIDTGLSDAMQPAPEQAPPQISLEEADARDRAAYEQFFANLDAEPVVGRYVENDDDIPDFDAASNVTDEEFLRSLSPTITDQEIQDAIATSSQSAIPQSSAASNAGPQAYEPAGPREGAGEGAASQIGQVNAGAIQQAAPDAPVPDVGGTVGADGAGSAAAAVSGASGPGGPGTGAATGSGAGATEVGSARDGGRGDSNQALSAPTNLRDALVRVRQQKQEAANAKAATSEAAPAAQSLPASGTGAVEADGVKPAGQRQLSADEQAAQDREEARAKELSLPPVLSARLQEAHKAHGRDVKRSVVERSIANEKANNTGTPKAKRERADRIARLEADLALFDEASAMPPKEAAGPASIPATIGANSESTPPQAIQAGTQPAQAAAAPAAGPAPTNTAAPAPAGAPEVRALSNGTPAENTGAQAAPAPGPQAAAPAEPEFTTIKTVYGDSVTVRTADLDGDKQRLRQYTKDGKSKAVPAIHRDNLDLTGDKRKASAKEDADNPFFNVIPTKDGSTFASQAAASRELNRLAMGETHEVVAASEVQDGAQGFVIRRKPVDAMAGRAETGGQQPAAPAAAELTLDEQLKQVNDQLANQGQVKSANTRAKRDQVRTAIAERDFPAILKAVDGDIDSAEAINQALQFAGDEPKAKVIERVLKNRGITDEYRQRWAERLMGEEGANNAVPAPPPGVVNVPPAIDAALDADMQAQKARITRLRNAATADGMSLDEKKHAQTQLKGAEFTLQTMRRTRFDAEDAALKAIEQNDMAPFAEHITFSKTEKALQQLIGAAPAPATAPAPASASPESESSQGSSNARGQDASAPPTTPEVKADDVEPKIMQSRPNDWPYANYGWVMVGGGRNAPGAASEKGAKIELSKTPEWKERGAVILPFRWNDGGLRGVSPYAETTTRYAILVRQKESPRIEASSETSTAPAAQPITRAEVTADPQQAAPKKKPNADKTRAKADALTEREKAAKAKMLGALGKLAALASKNTRMNWTPEEEQKLLPIVIELFDGAIELGAVTFQKAVAYVRDFIAQGIDQETADAIPFETLQGAYIAVAGRHKDKGVTAKKEVAGFESLEELQAADEPAPADMQTRSSTPAESLYQAIRAGNMPKDNPALKKLVESFDGKPADPARMKQAQEELETAIAMAARDIVAKGESDKATFDALLRLYESQPSLNIRTSTSVANQAYSTPAPLAYLASKLAGINQQTLVHEPTGGTGMLLIGADPKNAVVNELNDLRVSLLKEQGFNPTQKDAAIGPMRDGKGPVDAVITNPPFGSVKGEDGKPVKVKVDGYNIGQIDHLIAAHALATMKDDGRAVLILGANKAPGGLSTDDRIFFNWLYSHYNVVGHFEVEGDLYARQGAGWPVRVIVINGREKSSKLSPVAGTIQRADNWDQVYEQFNQILGSGRRHVRGAGDAAGRASDSQARQEGVPNTASAEAAGTGGSVARAGADGAGNVPGAGAGTVADRTGATTDPVGHIPDEQRLNGQSFVPPGLVEARPGADAPTNRPAKPAGTTAVAAAPAAAGNEFQTPYVPRSARKDEGVLIPSNMAQPTQDALNRLEDAVGDIDEFARKELGYESTEALHNALMGLQVDSVATAIYQIKQNKAVVIADQTGIGKGRQAASIIRWAARNGMTPVFVSVKPSLFTDMYGDLADIGTHDVAPFILNSTEWVSGADGEKLFANKPSTHRAAIQSIVDNAALPQGRNALFMTYSQINTANLQRQALMALAPNAVFVLDESHNAAGDSGTGDFMISVLKEARGVTYLSATYAKRPDNMPLYFKTDIGDAAADSEGLADAMAAGGLPLQTVVSNNLVKAGQMFRRERSYDGVSIASTFDTANRQLHERLSDEATEALRAIVSADKLFHSVFVKSMDKDLKAEGSQVQDNAGNQVSAGVQHTEFSSVVHNFVRQMLLGLKAQTAADEAIASLKRGEKPIIAVENTMGSFLSEYAAQNNINQGDSLGAFDYRTVLSRALERSRVINVVLPNGDKSKKNIALSELDPITRKAYDQAQAVIDGLAIDIPVSPIDWMRAEIARAGFSVAEITGRDLSVDYSNPRKPVLSAIDPTEQRDKVASTRRFNGGELDALILNVAGSTGISLHASEKFADQRQRHMIVAQAAGDINIFMQMLGRVHRTGQVRLPKYAILSVDLPTEKRPTAVLSRKMKSLNANTSSNTESATSVKTADILNKYGDQIVNQYLADNLELARQLGVDDILSSDGERVSDDIARKATGRLALQPIEVQRAFYEDVEAQYDALIEYLNKTNQNDLEPRTFDFDAKEVRTEILFDGPNKATPFGEDAVYGEYSIKAQGMAMKPEEIQAAIAESLQGKTGEEHARDLLNGLLQTYVEQTNAALAKKVGQGAAFDLDEYAAFLKPLFGEDGAAQMMAQAQAFMANGTQVGQLTVRDLSGAQGVGAGMEFLRNHAIGKTFRVEINSEPYNAVITNVRNTHKTTGNPFSLSKFQITLAVNGALRSITVPATQFKKIEVSSIAPAFRIETLFKEQPANQRETAKIVTGNLLAAYGEIKGARGTIISFTKADGVIEQGILLPKLFDFSKNTQGDYRLRSGADALKFLQQSTNKDIGRFGISTRDGQVRVLPRGDGVQVRVPKSKAQGARYFLDKNLIAVAGDFVSSANAMVANVDDAASAEKVLDLLMDKQALYALPSMADEAKSMAAPAASFSRAPSATSPADSNARNVATQRLADGLKANWTRAPEIIVARNMQDPQIPQAVRDYDETLKSQGATGEPRGFIYKGKVYLLSDELIGPAQIAEVLFHEVLGHYGLRGVFGDSLNSILQQMGTMRRKEVVAKAREYGLFDKDALGGLDKKTASDAQIWAAMSAKDRLSAAEEVLAEMAQTQPNIGFVQRAIAAIRNWLRAHVPGFKNLALTDADIIQAYILPARGYVTRSNETAQQAIDRAMLAFSRAPAGDQTQTEAFKRWFKGSKVVDADGKPLVVYHGTSADIDAFDLAKSGSLTRARSADGAFWFSDSPELAGDYAALSKKKLGKNGARNVMPVFLKMENPKIVDMAGKSYHELAVDFGAMVQTARKGVRSGTDWVVPPHDGMILRNFSDTPSGRRLVATHYVAFHPEQIKSATGNRGTFDPANPDIRFSRTTEAAKAVGDAIKSVTVTNIKQRAGFKLTDYLGIGLQALGRRQIVDIYGDLVPLAEYNRLVQQMEADKNEGGAEADQLVTRWAKLQDESKLADLMHDATLAQIDPAKPYVDGDDKARYMTLQGRFNALTDAAKQVYTDARDSYQAHHAKVRSAIKERIERSEIKGERKAALLKQMDDEFFAAVKGVYFPLARFGQYAVTVKGPDGKVESVSRAETKAEAEALRNNLLTAFPRDKGFTVGRVMLSKDFIADRDAVGRGFMTELYQVLDKQDMDATQRAELEDTLGQLYLSSLPDLSWAKHGIHRKGTPGFSQDARRAFAQNMFHGARYLAKLRYSDLMQDELAAMQKHVDDWREVEDFDQNSAQRVVDEMNKRHESLMNPASNPLSTALTSLGFVFHLGLSPASAMVNLSQTALVAYPIMGAKWGFGKASAALLKASAEAAKGKNDITASLNADERAAYDEAVRAGTIDVTMAHDLAGIAQGEDAGVMWKIRPVMRWASFLFHHAERFNRQVTFVAAYRLAREAGADHKAAFEQATKATYDGHFDYGAANRPRIMQGNVAKVLLLFKQYGQNMVYTLARNAQQAIKGESPEVRAQARKALGGLLATHAAAAGVLGLPMVTTLLAAASMIGGDDDEPWDAKVALQNMLADTFGQKPAEVLAHGLSRLTPWDISGRVGLDRLIFPDVQEGLEGQRLAESAMAAALGPVAGIGVNVLKGAQHMGEGRYALGLEAMLPSALRGPVKAIRYANEGVQDKSGISILDEVSPAAVAGQALGFSPSQARNAQEGKSAVMAHDRALGERRQELLTKAARAAMDKDAEALAEARKEIAGFNEKNPGRRITPLNITQSVRNRQKRIDQSQDGVYLPKNRRDAMEAGRFAVAD